MERTCKNCGAVYHITERHIPMRDSDSINCDLCGAELMSWHKVSKDFTHKLKTPGCIPPKATSDGL